MKITLLAAALLFSPLAASAGMAEAAPGVHRSDSAVYIVLGACLVLLVLIILSTQGGWQGKGRDKKDRLKPPYF
jgi:hypothetical protein